MGTLMMNNNFVLKVKCSVLNCITVIIFSVFFIPPSSTSSYDLSILSFCLLFPAGHFNWLALRALGKYGTASGSVDFMASLHGDWISEYFSISFFFERYVSYAIIIGYYKQMVLVPFFFIVVILKHWLNTHQIRYRII